MHWLLSGDSGVVSVSSLTASLLQLFIVKLWLRGEIIIFHILDFELLILLSREDLDKNINKQISVWSLATGQCDNKTVEFNSADRVPI